MLTIICTIVQRGLTLYMVCNNYCIDVCQSSEWVLVFNVLYTNKVGPFTFLCVAWHFAEGYNFMGESEAVLILMTIYRNLAIGIGIQNFPEGLAVSLPLRASGLNVWKSFWYNN